MKSKLIFFGMLCFNLSFGQNSLSVGSVNPLIPVAPNEIFRFQPGNVTQLDSGTGFGTSSNDRWFSIGKVQTGTNLAYGLRFQTDEKSLTFGYQSVNSLNPRIQWIGTGATLGNLEFRVANSFTSTASTLVASMTKEGNSFFGIDRSSLGTTAKVNIRHNQSLGLNIENKFVQTVPDGTGFRVASSTGFNTNIGGDIITDSADEENTGLRLLTRDGKMAMGVRSTASASTANGLSSSYGFFGETFGVNAFEAAIYGLTPNGFGSQFAGFFDGATFSTTGWGPSDAKLKENIKQERSALEKLAQLKPVTYDYKVITQLNLPKGIQHGFVAQELAAVFPELTKDISKPVFDKDGKSTEIFDFKSVNYNGLISVLTAGINELNEKLKALKEEIATLKDSKSSERKGLGSSSENTKGFSMEQNIPNPFGDQTIIKYQLPEGTTTAEIMVFDLNGRLIKSYAINKNQSQQTIKASEIGSGIFIYSLVQNGQELMTKKMIVK